MRVHRERDVDVAWAVSRALLEEDRWSWFDLDDDRQKAVYLIGSPADGLELRRMGVLQHGPALREGPDRLTSAVRLEAEEHPRWFPTFIGQLQATDTGAGTRLALDGEYVVPIGPAGELVDRLVLHRLAESSLDSLLEQLVAGLVTGDRYAVMSA